MQLHKFFERYPKYVAKPHTFGEFNDPIPGPLCIIEDRLLSFDFAGSQAHLILDLLEVRVGKVERRLPLAYGLGRFTVLGRATPDRAGARPYHWSSRTPPGAASSAPLLPFIVLVLVFVFLIEDEDEFEDDYD